ncbi:YadA family autotransporter adhesin, partial [Burkholderia ubonensis]|uniref:YadA family autotransporter adhesin n=1 Tax=Burkholderia ubonensis TaxID=101571 RepID=UPI0039F4ADEC
MALGANAVTANSNPTSSATIGGQPYNFAGATPTSVVSVGSVGAERQVTNVAAGRLSATSTDAINGSQLFATNAAINSLSTSVTGSTGSLDNLGNSTAAALGGGATYNSTTSAISAPSYTTYNANGTTATANDVGSAIDNLNNQGIKYFHANSTAADSVATGTDSVAIGPSAIASGNQSVALGDIAAASGTRSTALGFDAIASNANATAVGVNSNATGLNSVAIGSGSSATTTNGVALGAGAVTGNINPTPNGTIGGQNYTYAGGVPNSVVSVGNVNAERQVTNVAAGRVTAASTDAINGSQLFATNTAINLLSTSTSTGISTAQSGVNSLSTGLSSTNSAVGSLSTSASTGISTAQSGVNSLSTGLSSTNSAVGSLSTSASTG